MIGIVLKRAIEEYLTNFSVMLSFGVLFLFLTIFALFNQFFFSSGSVFFSFSTGFDLVGFLLGLIAVLVFLYFFSFFISLTVYAVHRNVQHINFDTYWNTLFKSAASKIFVFYLVLSIIFYLINFVGLTFGLVFWALLINLVLGFVLLFVPQSIVLDEVSVIDGIRNNFDFLKNNFFVVLIIFLSVSLALFFVFFIELFLQSLELPGAVVSFFLVLVVLIPFFEQVKSFAYLMRNDLLKSNEFVHARAPKKIKKKTVYATRLREQPKKGSKL